MTAAVWTGAVTGAVMKLICPRRIERVSPWARPFDCARSRMSRGREQERSFYELVSDQAGAAINAGSDLNPGCGAAGGTRHAINQTIEGCAPTDPTGPPGDCAGTSEDEGSRNPRPSDWDQHTRAERVERVGEQLAHARGEGCWRL